MFHPLFPFLPSFLPPLPLPHHSRLTRRTDGWTDGRAADGCSTCGVVGCVCVGERKRARLLERTASVRKRHALLVYRCIESPFAYPCNETRLKTGKRRKAHSVMQIILLEVRAVDVRRGFGWLWPAGRCDCSSGRRTSFAGRRRRRHRCACGRRLPTLCPPISSPLSLSLWSPERSQSTLGQINFTARGSWGRKKKRGEERRRTGRSLACAALITAVRCAQRRCCVCRRRSHREHWNHTTGER